jgi:hypothetical protein
MDLRVATVVEGKQRVIAVARATSYRNGCQTPRDVPRPDLATQLVLD